MEVKSTMDMWHQQLKSKSLSLILYKNYYGALKAFPVPSMTEVRHEQNVLSSNSAMDSGRTN